MEANGDVRERPQVPSPPDLSRARWSSGEKRQVGDARQEAEPQLAPGCEATGDRRDRLAAQHQIAKRLDQLRVGAARLVGRGRCDCSSS